MTGVLIPQLLAGRRFVAAHPAVALAVHHLVHAADVADRRRRPLPVQHAVADRVVFPLQLAALDLDRDDRRRLRRRDVDVAFVLAVRRRAIEQAAVDHRRAVRQVVREGSDLFHHVEHPDDVHVGLAGELLVLVRTVVLAVMEALNVGGNDLAAIRREIRDAADHRGRAGDALIRPVVGAARRQLLERRLPHELAAVFVERHQHAAIADGLGELGVERGYILGLLRRSRQREEEQCGNR